MVVLCKGKGVFYCKKDSENNKYIEKCFEDDIQKDFRCIKKISLIPMDKNIYEKHKTNRLKMLVLIATSSLKKEGIINIYLENILERMDILLKYYDINYPDKGKNKVYFKPSKSKIINIMNLKKVESVCL